MITIDQLKKLREKTSAGVMDCRKALEEAKGDEKKAEELIKQWASQKAEKKAGRETSAGLVESYVHAGKVGVLVEVLCETDFVARTDNFKNLAHEIALQIASMNPKDVNSLMKQEYIRDPKLTIEKLVKETIGKLGENIRIGKFARIRLGE
ncbi:translation elongation factor Ts [Candidatus Gottesmanbacteria bacterium]|nr:translation elongation factor Ts [Candidatus Gottesmanbacteria bacterium]